MFACRLSRRLMQFVGKPVLAQVQYAPCVGATALLTTAFRVPNLQITSRYKHRDSKKSARSTNVVSDDTEDDEDQQVDEWEVSLVDKQNKLITVRINSLRADLVLKAGLGIARNKVETLFYESKIRVNGQRLLKKAAMVGDEIDVERGVSPANPDFLTVSRLEILSVSEKGEGLSVKLRRNKALTIEGYSNEAAGNR